MTDSSGSNANPSGSSLAGKKTCGTGTGANQLQSSSTKAALPAAPQLSHIDQLFNSSSNWEVTQLRQQQRDATFIAGRLALAGQSTVFYAAPGTGKTLLLLKLVAEAIANGTAGPHVYHLNLDDTFEGLIEKADLGNRYGFLELSPAQLPKPRENFEGLVDKLIEEGSARDAIFILDTLKKFTDVMDKKDSSEFMTICRRFTCAGGSIIALSHANKHTDADGQPIPSGTSDVKDDCDCSYTMSVIDEVEENGSKKRLVKFTSGKARGPVVKEAIYSYIQSDDADYAQIFHSVRLVDGNDLDKLRQEKALQNERNLDSALIDDISTLLSSSEGMLQKDLLEKLSKQGPHSRRDVTRCLKQWEGPTDRRGLWTAKRGSKNSHIYRLN